MVPDERSRHELAKRLERVLGTEAATTVLEYLPPVGWADIATKHDLHELEQRTGARFEVLEARIDGRFDAVDGRFETLEIRVGAVEERLEARIDAVEGRLEARIEASEERLLAAFRGELVTAVVGQTRAMIFTMAGTIVSLGGLALALARFA